MIGISKQNKQAPVRLYGCFDDPSPLLGVANWYVIGENAQTSSRSSETPESFALGSGSQSGRAGTVVSHCPSDKEKIKAHMN